MVPRAGHQQDDMSGSKVRVSMRRQLDDPPRLIEPSMGHLAHPAGLAVSPALSAAVRIRS